MKYKTTQEAVDKFNESSREFWKQVFDAIFDAINTAYGWIPKLTTKIKRNVLDNKNRRP